MIKVRGVNMSEWGFWGYVGIVAGLVLMLAVFFGCVLFMYRKPEASEAEPAVPAQEHPERAAGETKHAA